MDTPLLFGIAGGSCSGKTTLEQNLLAVYGDELSLVSFDDFFVGLSALRGKTIDNWESPDLYRWDTYRDTIHRLRSGEEARFEPHSNESKAAGIRERVIKPRQLVVATGFLALHDAGINERFDTTLFIDLPETEMVRRPMARAALRPPGPWDNPEYINQALIPGTRQFVHPQREIADYVIDGMQSTDTVAAEVLDVIETYRASH